MLNHIQTSCRSTIGVIIICALLGCDWAVPAEAASERHRAPPAQATTSRAKGSGLAAHRQGRHDRAPAHRETHASRARLKPGHEVIDHSGRPQRGRASYYGREFYGRKMANGRRFDPNLNIAASRSLPLGTIARVKNLRTKQETTVKVEDRGPYVPGRILDVAPRAADDLGIRKRGVAPVMVEPIAVPQPDGSVRSVGSP
jgi:rare lipoprotein A